MASAVLAHPQLFKQDLDMDSFFDFNQSTPQPQPQPRQIASSSSRSAVHLDDIDTQVFAGPSHQYDQFRQQTGVPVGDLYSLNQPMQTDYFGTGFDSSWQTPISDTDGIMSFGANMPIRGNARAMSPISECVDPITIEEDQPSNVGRLWPGMHQQQAQQAAQAEAQAQARQLAQTQMDLPTVVTHPRQPSIVPSINEDDSVSNGFMPNPPRNSKKDDDDIDEDERLLASDEGKKLSSKERRQLRNKVSARAFRSRRKEYITQLEGELNAKAQECNNLKTQNTELSDENARYRNLIQFLIRQPTFAPVLAELNKDPAMSGMQGLALLPPTTGPQPQQVRTFPGQAYRHSNPPHHNLADPNMPGGSSSGTSFSFQ